MPFIAALGYDVFNPLEVIPEFVADLGIKKGEKVDYCLQKDGAPTMLIECKHWKEDLNVHNSQLHRYFHVTNTRIGLLTNGIIYRFYSDLQEPNKMDDKPFWEINIADMSEASVFELKKFQKNQFDVSSILNSASELKYAREVKNIMTAELAAPTEAFVRHFGKQIYTGVMTAKVVEQFTAIVKKSLNQLISEMISDRLKSALSKESDAALVEVHERQMEEAATAQPVAKVVTTDLEVEAYHIVRSIVRTRILPSRIIHRDNQTYFGILLDDNNRKPICRLYLNASKWYLVLFDESKKEVKVEISSLDDIYKYADNLLATALSYDAK